MNDAEEFSISRPRPLFLRLMFGAAGLFTMATPLWEFRQAFLHPSWASLFFLAITLGAWSVGIVFVAAAIFDEDQSWRVRKGVIEIARRNMLKRWTTTFRLEDVRETSIAKATWDSGPDTYAVKLTLKNGEVFETYGCEKRENAEALQARILRLLTLV